MTKREITYVDFNGLTRTDSFYFNLTRSEITQWNYDVEGGFTEYLDSIVKSKDTGKLIGVVRDFILRAYGVKSPDGRRLEKSDELRTKFFDTPAYDQMFMEFVENPETFSAFVKLVVKAPEAIDLKSAGGNVTQLPQA